MFDLNKEVLDKGQWMLGECKQFSHYQFHESFQTPFNSLRVELIKVMVDLRKLDGEEDIPGENIRWFIMESMREKCTELMSQILTLVHSYRDALQKAHDKCTKSKTCTNCNK